MRYPLSILLTALFILPASVRADPTVPQKGQTLKDFVPRGWAILAKAEGDLNRDGKADAALVLKNTAEDRDGQTEEVPRLLVLLLRSSNGYVLSGISEKAIFCKNCGGMLGDPFQTIKIDRGSLVVNQTGGSREVWNLTFRFRFQRQGRQDEWLLIGWTSESYDRATGESTTRDFNLLTGDVITTEERIDEHEKKLPPGTHRTKRKPVSLKLKDFNPEDDLLATP